MTWNLGHWSACFARASMYLLRSNPGYRLHVVSFLTILLPWLDSPWWAGASLLTRLHDHTVTHTPTHTTQQDSSGRMIDLLQHLLTVNTQHSQQTDIQASGGIRTRYCGKWVAGIGIDASWKCVFHMVIILLSSF